MLIADLFVTFAISLAASCNRPLWRRCFGGDWYDLALNTMGVLLIWPAFEKMHHSIDLPDGLVRRSIAFLLAAGSVGAGAAAGRVVVPERKN